MFRQTGQKHSNYNHLGIAVVDLWKSLQLGLNDGYWREIKKM